MLGKITFFALVLSTATLTPFTEGRATDSAVTTLQAKDIPVTIDSLGYYSTLGQVDDVKLLLKAGVKPNGMDKSGSAPLVHAAWHGRDNVVVVLLEAGADPNITLPDGLTPMLAAAGQGHPSVIPILASKGGNPNAVDRSGATPLIHATFSGNAALVKALLKAGADPTIGASGQSAIEIARARGNVEILDLLTAQVSKKR